MSGDLLKEQRQSDQRERGPRDKLFTLLLVYRKVIDTYKDNIHISLPGMA